MPRVDHHSFYGTVPEGYGTVPPGVHSIPTDSQEISFSILSQPPRW
jgi:hypothetical protein